MCWSTIKKGNCLWQWSKPMDLRTTFSKGLCWQVRDGEKINFWKDNWLHNKSLLELGVYDHDNQRNNINANVSDFISIQGVWNWNILNEILPSSIVKDIKCLHIPLNKIEYKLLWGYSANGEYTVKSAIWLAQGLQDSYKDKCNFHWIWKLNIPNKTKTFSMECLCRWLTNKAKTTPKQRLCNTTLCHL